MTSPTQITIRNVSQELAERLRALSKARGESLNATVLHLLRDAVGIRQRCDRLARYATWTGEDQRAFEQALGEQRVVDEEKWR